MSGRTILFLKMFRQLPNWPKFAVRKISIVLLIFNIQLNKTE